MLVFRSNPFPAAVSLLVFAGLVSCGNFKNGENAGSEDARAEARIQLGRELFFDTRLSADETISCASCHDLEAGGDDGLATAVGIQGAVGPINTPTVFNSSLNFAQFWDGRAKTLQEQAAEPIQNPEEMGSSWEQTLNKLSLDQKFTARFSQAYEDGLTAANLADAIALYENALLTLNSPFDRYQAGEKEALSASAQAGYEHFQNLGCSSCHQGRAIGGNMFQRFGVMGDYFADRGLPVTVADLGRYNVTHREADKFRFKVPSLRNVARTSPYFHDGSTVSLADAVALMAKYQLGEPVTDEQIADIVEFLKSLNGEIDPRLGK